MSNGRFLILLRRRQNQSEGVDVTIQCNPVTGYAEYVPGTVDNTTPYGDIIPEDGWYDFSGLSKNGKEYIEPESVSKLAFTWDKVNVGNSSNSETNQDGSNYDKGVTSDLWFRDLAYQFIYDWLLSDECKIVNAVEVKITDLIAGGTYRIFEIKADNLDYAPVDEPCQFLVKLRERDSNWACIHKTFIFDNWQHWFEDSGVKTHPCFLTCIEPRPRLVQSVRMALMIFYHSNPIGVFFGINHGVVRENAREILNANRFIDSPLVRTYIKNVAGKCGLETDTIFDEGQDWENLCLYYPQSGFMHESDGNSVASPSLAYHFENRWLITVAELLDKLKFVFCSEWYVTPGNTIVFKYTKDLVQVLPIYDFTAAGAEPIYDLRYSFNGDKKPAFGRYEYTDDGSDLASQETSTLYNDIIDYDGPANNPILEGERIKNLEFAPTGFIRDGRAKDYLNLLINDGKVGALILLIIIFLIDVWFALSLPFTAVTTTITSVVIIAWIAAVAANVSTLKNTFVDDPTYTGAVRLTSEQVLTPRLILWDGVSEQRAKAVATIALPTPNTYYNPTSVPYNVKNNIGQDNPTNTVYNYPTYFDGDFTGNLFDNYHDPIDNPLKSKESHQEAKWSVDLCDNMLNLFGVFESQYAVIGKVVKLEARDNYDVYVRIGNINVDYDSNKINLKGTVLRRA